MHVDIYILYMKRRHAHIAACVPLKDFSNVKSSALLLLILRIMESVSSCQSGVGVWWEVLVGDIQTKGIYTPCVAIEDHVVWKYHGVELKHKGICRRGYGISKQP